MCGKALSKGASRCRDCWVNRGPDAPHKPPRIGLCGHPISRGGTKTCRACYDHKRTVLQASTGGKRGAESTLSVKGDTAELGRITNERVRTLADLIRVCEIDTQEWLVERWVANKWEMGSKDLAGNPQTTPLYQVKAWLKRNLPIIAARDEIQALIADARKGLPVLPKVGKSPHSGNSGLMLELNVADLHMGKLGWDGETGHGNYDSKIAEAEHDRAVDTLLTRLKPYTFEEIVIVFGNDLLHVDGRANTTTAGTAQDMDSRYYKVFLSTRRMATRMIDRCRKLAKVRAVMVSGNHDRDSVWHLGDSLACLYEQASDVTIDNGPTQRKYVEFGQCMLLFSHGHLGKREDYPLLMATEQPAMFGRTRYREAHTGHLHTTRVQEFHGVRVRILPSLSSPDSWHAENGFVGNIRAAEAFVWSRNEGLIATAFYNADFRGKIAERAQC